MKSKTVRHLSVAITSLVYFLLLFFLPTAALAGQVPEEANNIPFDCAEVDPTINVVDAALNDVSYADSIDQAVKQTVCNPQPRISLPFLSFTDITDQSGFVQLDPESGDVILYVPFLGDYISGIYRYSLVVIVTIAVIMIIVAGIRWMTSAANSDAISESKKMIFNALMGIVIAASSYAILYTINPELVTFKNLAVTIIQADNLDEYSDSTSYFAQKDAEQKGESLPAPPPPIYLEGDATTYVPPTSNYTAASQPQALCRSIESCTQICRAGNYGSIAPTPGMSAQSETVLLSAEISNKNLIGLQTRSGIRIRPELLPPLIAAGRSAYEQGYDIYVNSGWRSLQSQLNIACKRILAGTFSNRYLAWPGGSNHGGGSAIDITLRPRGSSQNLSGITSKSQNQEKYRPYNKILAEIMFSTGWKRLKSEVWHFEYPASPLQSSRTKGEDPACFETSCS